MKLVGDGTFFEHGQDSEPDAHFLIEVRAVDHKPVWYDALAPLTSHEVRVSLDDYHVWLKPVTAPANDFKYAYDVLTPIAIP